MALFTIQFELKGEGKTTIDYDSVDDFLKDEPVKALFTEGLVDACSVHAGGKKIAGLPFMEYKRLHDVVVDHSTDILKASGR